MDFVEAFNVLLDLHTIFFAIVVAVELPLCVIVIVVTLS